MKGTLIRWTLLGLLIRLLIMPFSFHGSDIFYIYYSPFKFVYEGIANPYLYHTRFISHSPPPYLPVIFFILSLNLFIFKPLLSHLPSLFSRFEDWYFKWEGNTIHYADALVNHQLFRALFIFKLPYLLFDFGCGWLLFQIMKGDRQKGLSAYKLWMFNPFVLHGCYAVGQVDIIYTFFTIAALYFMFLHYRHLSVITLSLGAFVKTIPVLLIPCAILILGKTFKARFKLLASALLMMVVIIAPFYFFSPEGILASLTYQSRHPAAYRGFAFGLSYIALLCLLFTSKKEDPDFQSTVFSLAIPLLLLFSLYDVTIRYFIIVTPFLIITALFDKRLWMYNIIFIIALFGLKTAGNSQQWGLFSALHPEFFSSLPIADSYLNLVMNVKVIHQALNGLFFVSSLAMAVHLFLKLFKRRLWA